MNLQRYVSTVYCESIKLKDKTGNPTKYLKDLNEDIQKVYQAIYEKTPSPKSPTFEELRTSYVINIKSHSLTPDEKEKEEKKRLAEEAKEASEEATKAEQEHQDKNKDEKDKAVKEAKERIPSKIQSFLIHSMFLDKLFGNNLIRLYQDHVNTVFLFPVYREKPNSIRLKDPIREIYSSLVEKPTSTDFTRDNKGNLYMFVPAFSEDEETSEEFTDRIGIYLDRAFDFILEQKPKQIGGVVENKQKLESIIYTVGKEGNFFTDYYKKKLPETKGKVLNEKIEKFVQKLGCRLLTPIDTLKKLTKEDTSKKYREQFGQLGDKDKRKLKAFDQLVDDFIDIYKQSTDEEYRRMVSSRENQSTYRIFYRIHNTDTEEVYDEVKTGSTHVYELSYPEDPKKPDVLTYLYGYFNERKGETNQYIFKEYEGISSQQKDLRSQEREPKKKEDIEAWKKRKKEKEEELKNKLYDIHEDPHEEKKDMIVEVKKKGGRLMFKKASIDDFSDNYPGRITLFKELHIYERYKWFHFNELDGTLPSETKIKYYKNLRFDRSSMIDFLKSKNQYTDKTRVAVEFLKTNIDSTLLSEYASFLITKKQSTHVYKDSTFGVKLPAFIEKTKKSIIDLLFESNELLYLSGQKSTKEKKDISKNYKIVGHQYYKVDPEIKGTYTEEEKTKLIEKRVGSIEPFFERIIYDNHEKDYCKKKSCEILKEVRDNPPNMEFGVAIVDVTKENIEAVSELKQKTKCKRLRKTLRRQLRPFVDFLLPRFYGGKSRHRTTKSGRKRGNRLTRRKNGH
jgi:hypothetical protein